MPQTLMRPQRSLARPIRGRPIPCDTGFCQPLEDKIGQKKRQQKKKNIRDPNKGQLTVQHRSCDGPLTRVESDTLRVIRQREEDDDITYQGKEAPAQKEKILFPLKQLEAEGSEDGADCLVPVAHEEAADAVDNEAEDRQDAEGPGEANGVDHGVAGEGVDEAAEAGAGGRQGAGERTATVEPLWHDADGGVEVEAHADAKGDALAEEEVPDPGAEGGGYEGHGLSDDAEAEGFSCAGQTNRSCDERSDEEGCKWFMPSMLDDRA